MPYPWSAGNVLTATDLNSSLAAKTDTAMVQNAQTGTSYSYALADASKLLSMSNAASNTVLVTKQATVTWVTGTQLRVINLGVGVTTLVADTGVTINNNRSLAQYQGGTLIRTASDVWTFQPNGQKILQVVNATFATTTTTTSATFVTSGLSASITPSSASSKIFIVHNGAANQLAAANIACCTIFRGTVAGTNLGDATFGLLSLYASTASMLAGMSMSFLDSPASISPVTYTVGIRAASGATLTAQYNSTPSVLTLMEVSA